MATDPYELKRKADPLADAIADVLLHGIEHERWPDGTVSEKLRADVIGALVAAIDKRIAGFRGDSGKGAYINSVERLRHDLGEYANMCDDAAELLTQALGDREIMRHQIVEGIRLLLERQGGAK